MKRKNINLREVGVTLPAYASQEGCGVEVQDWRNGAGRQLGRLGGDQKTQVLFEISLFRRLRRPPFLAAGMRNTIAIVKKRCFEKVTLLKFLSGNIPA